LNEKETEMRETFIEIAAAAVLAGSAWDGTTVCQRIGTIVSCNDGTTILPLGDGAYVLKDEPRDGWGQPRPQPGHKDDRHDH
jgi:hypothetical protein